MTDSTFDASALIGLMSEAEARVDRLQMVDFDVLMARAPGSVATPGFHWTLFGRVVADLRPDGHARCMEPLPPLPFERRMWAGSAIVWHLPLCCDDAVRRRTRVSNAVLKTGRSGPMLVVSLDHTITLEGRGVAIEERQDLVFLEGKAAPRVGHAEPLPFSADWQEPLRFDEVTLFTYSALTRNTHRIHYDHPYATGVEGYPGLVVHGPLLATRLMHAAMNHAMGGLALRRFEFRQRRPVFCAEQLTMIGARTDAPGEQRLALIDSGGGVAMTAFATFVESPGVRVSSDA